LLTYAHLRGDPGHGRVACADEPRRPANARPGHQRGPHSRLALRRQPRARKPCRASVASACALAMPRARDQRARHVPIAPCGQTPSSRATAYSMQSRRSARSVAPRLNTTTSESTAARTTARESPKQTSRATSVLPEAIEAVGTTDDGGSGGLHNSLGALLVGRRSDAADTVARGTRHPSLAFHTDISDRHITVVSWSMVGGLEIGLALKLRRLRSVAGLVASRSGSGTGKRHHLQTEDIFLTPRA
jgi:hypothetical protein